MHHVYIRFLFCILSTVILLQTFQSARADIYQWEWIDSAHPELGKRESSTLCPNGAGVNAVPNAEFGDRNLTRAYFLGANVANAYFDEPTLTDADFTRAYLSGSFFFRAHLDNTDFSYAYLSNVSFNSSYLGNAIFTDAIIKDTWLFYGFTKEQLFSTASYKLKDLTGVRLGIHDSYIDLSNCNLANQNLTGARLFADFSNAIFSDAIIRNASLFGSTFTKEQLYSTASYKNKDLSGVYFYNNLADCDFTHQNLTNAGLCGTLTYADFTDAIITGADLSSLSKEQLYTTASYKSKNLSGVYLGNRILSDWDLSSQNLSGGDFNNSYIEYTNFTDAVVNGVNFSSVHGLSHNKLYSTASYKNKNLSGIKFDNLDMSGCDFRGQNLTNVRFGTTFTGIVFDDSIINGANFYWATFNGLTQSQFYSTASYENKNLQEVVLRDNDLRGWDFSNQNLTNAIVNDNQLANAIFTDAIITGASFSTNSWNSPPRASDLTREQLYSTASYKSKDLSRINMCAVNLDGWNFISQNLSNSKFECASLVDVDFSHSNLFGTSMVGANMANSNLSYSYLSNANFSYAKLPNINLLCADTRGAFGMDLSDAITTNTILPDGMIHGLNLSGSNVLVIRDYDGDPIGYPDWSPPVPPHGPIAITIQNSMNIGINSGLKMIFEEDAWDSTISFVPGIPVTLGGTLDLSFAQGVRAKKQLGRTFDLFDWTGVWPTGTFNVASEFVWDISKLYTTGEVTMVYDPTLADTRWTGSKNGKWNDAANWTAGVPGAGKIVEFNSGAPSNQPVMQNIANPLVLNAIGFAPGAGTHILGGPTIKFDGELPGIACASDNDQYINNTLEITAETGIVVYGSGQLILGGEIIGAGSLVKTGSGTMVLMNSGTYSGNTDIEEGILALDATGQILNSSIMNNAHFQILDGDHIVRNINGDGATEVITGTLTADSIQQDTLCIGTKASMSMSSSSSGSHLTSVPEPGALFLLTAGLISFVGFGLSIRK